MAKRKYSPEEKLQIAVEQLRQDFERWFYIDEYGCNDPNWPDGTNMNLVRRHIQIDRDQIEKLCEETGSELPEEYNLPVPPKVNDGYMVNFSNTRRVQMLSSHKVLTNEK